MPHEIIVKSVLNKTKRRDPWFLDDYTFNPYSSCSFNCLFCYIRGSKYGANLEKSLSVKVNAIELLDKQLGNRARKGQYGVIVLSSATDPYLHFEAQYKRTRSALEVILKHRFPVHVITRSDLVVRDMDLMRTLNTEAILPPDLRGKLSGVTISFSFSTLDDKVAGIFEPGATPPSARLGAVKAVKSAGFRTGVCMMPLLPYISDTTQSLEQMFSAFREANVDYVLPATLTLWGEGPADSKTLVKRAVVRHFPELAEKYEKLFADSSQLPWYYRNAFDKKMDELCGKYGLAQSILLAHP